MELGNSNTLLILSLQLTKIATVCKRTIPQRLSSKVPEVGARTGHGVDLALYVVLLGLKDRQLTSIQTLPVVSDRVVFF